MERREIHEQLVVQVRVAADDADGRPVQAALFRPGFLRPAQRRSAARQRSFRC